MGETDSSVSRAGRLWPKIRLRVVDRPSYHARRWAMRKAAERRLDTLVPGVSVVAVSFNSADCTDTLVHAVRRFTEREVPIIIVDNASDNGAPHVDDTHTRVIELGANHGHGRAMDIGVLSVRTTHFIALDIDAFPIRSDWVDVVLNPLDGPAIVSGGRVDPEVLPQWDYAHPSFLAMSLSDFVLRGHTFEPGVVHGVKCDVGQQISVRERPNVHFIETTSRRGPGPIGTVFGGVVYHNFYGTRFSTGATVLNDIVKPDDPTRAWDDAVREYLGAI